MAETERDFSQRKGEAKLLKVVEAKDFLVLSVSQTRSFMLEIVLKMGIHVSKFNSATLNLVIFHWAFAGWNNSSSLGSKPWLCECVSSVN